MTWILSKMTQGIEEDDQNLPENCLNLTLGILQGIHQKFSQSIYIVYVYNNQSGYFRLSEWECQGLDSPRVWEAMSPWFRESRSTQDYPRVKATQAK